MALFFAGLAVGVAVTFVVMTMVVSSALKDRHAALSRAICSVYAAAADEIVSGERNYPRFEELDPGSAATVELVRGLFLQLPKRIAEPRRQF